MSGSPPSLSGIRVVDASTLLLFRFSMRRAALVLAASQATAADLAGIASARVVYSAASQEFSPGRRAHKGYFLHLASDDPRRESDNRIGPGRGDGRERAGLDDSEVFETHPRKHRGDKANERRSHRGF